MATLLLLAAGGPATWSHAQGSASTSRGAQQRVNPGPTTTWTLAAAGDAIINRRIGQFDNDQDPHFRDMARIIRGADVAFLNLEQSLFRHAEFAGWPEAEHGGNWDFGPPEVALDLQAIGFDLFNRANNHTTDYGVEGMRVTNRWLDEIGIVHAGSGMNLGAASRPGYLDTAKGRVALIGVATTFTPMSRAGNARPDSPGRPGLNALRIDRRYQVDEATYQALRAIRGDIADAVRGAAATVPVEDDPRGPLTLFGGARIEPGPRAQIIDTVNQADQGRILREIRNATDQADYVLVAIHAHQPGVNSQESAPWFTAFARACIDAGAVAVLASGPHQLRGVEIHAGRPIFHSLGNFVFQNETVDPVPADHYERYDLPDTALVSDLYDARYKNGTIGYPSGPIWYQSVIAVPEFKGRQLVQLKMYPIDLQQTAPRSQRGTPRLATGATARAILDRLADLSAALGTAMTREGGVLVWRAPAQPAN